MKKIVIALGGNAILKKGEKPTINTQIRNTEKALRKLLPVFKKNKVVITHGNGPQAGYLLLQNELAKSKVAQMPLDVLDAETEGQIGYLIQQNLNNLFRHNKIYKNIVTVLTQVLVSAKDPAFRKPTKYVGPFYEKKEADKLKKKYKIIQDGIRGYRRVVPSPKPLQIIESHIIENMMKHDTIVIAAGGGGIPVVRKHDKLEGVEAVVDKDLASACLGNSISADELIMITDVDAVYLNYGTRNQEALRKTNLKKIRKYYDNGHFHEGSMKPKIEAAMHFLTNGKKKVIITNIMNIEKALKGHGGTTIVR